jgi:hypothetical protein
MLKIKEWGNDKEPHFRGTIGLFVGKWSSPNEQERIQLL